MPPERVLFISKPPTMAVDGVVDRELYFMEDKDNKLCLKANCPHLRKSAEEAIRKMEELIEKGGEEYGKRFKAQEGKSKKEKWENLREEVIRLIQEEARKEIERERRGEKEGEEELAEKERVAGLVLKSVVKGLVRGGTLVVISCREIKKEEPNFFLWIIRFVRSFKNAKKN